MKTKTLGRLNGQYLLLLFVFILFSIGSSVILGVFPNTDRDPYYFTMGYMGFLYWGVLLGTILLFVRKQGKDFGYFFRFKDLDRGIIAKTFWIVVFSFPVAMFMNTLAISLLEKFGHEYSAVEFLEIDNLPKIIISFLIVSVTAGIIEEVIFRGYFLNSYKRFLGSKKAIIYSAVLFGLFHLDPNNLLSPIYLGLVFGILAVKTGSLVPAIFAHMLHNGTTILLSLMTTGVEVEQGAETAFEYGSLLGALAFPAAISLVFVIAILKRIPGSIGTDDMEVEKSGFRIASYIPLIVVGLIYFGIVYLSIGGTNG